VASTYSNLKIQLMATGENSGTWGNVTNANLGDAIEQAIVETADVTFASNNVTLTLSDSNSRQNARALRLNLTGTTAGARDLIVPAIQKPYLVNNGTADTITVKVSGQTGIAVPASTSMLLYNNGTDVGLAFNRVVADVVGNLTGTASNATVLQTARNIQISGNVTAANVSFDGSAAVNLNVTDINAAGITSGTLGVARGGTAASTLTAENVIIGNGTSAVKFVAPGTSGNVLTSNGTAWASQAIAAGGDYVQQVYTSPATWTKPASVKAIKVTVVGGGGGGQGARSGNDANPCSGNGGGGGGTAIEYIDAPSIPGPVSVTVGSGGSGGPSSINPDARVSTSSGGGTSSFGGFLSATGGGGLAAPPGFGAPPTRAPAGAGSGGDYNLNGSVGGQQSSNASNGGSAFNPFGFGINTASGPGTAAPGPAGATGGGGGAGAFSQLPGGGAAGGNGGVGIVIVEEFY
jgi:hypothetical protein